MMKFYISGDVDALMRLMRLAERICFHITTCGIHDVYLRLLRQ